MSFATWCIVLGAGTWLASYFLNDLFVDRSDSDNPLRSLTRGVGYVGLIAGVYGLILVVAEALR